MKHVIPEAAYPLSFRQHDAEVLGSHLQNRHSVELIGMKRVGIHSFIRFFVFHRRTHQKYMPHDGKNIFILVDLNDLIERELFAFWRLTLKRIADAAESYIDNEIIQKKISNIFLTCIQSGDFFLTYDGVKEALTLITEAGYFPTIFFDRFDRLKNVMSVELFDNLQSLHDACAQKLSYVFTSFRKLSNLAPTIFDTQLLSVLSNLLLSNTLYIKPCLHTDEKIMLDAMLHGYKNIPLEIKDNLLNISGGHMQYLRVSVIIANELLKKEKNIRKEDFIDSVNHDERILLLSEEIWETLTENEQNVLKKIAIGEKITDEEKIKTKYLSDTGFIIYKTGKPSIFNQIFTTYIFEKQHQRNTETIELSKKELILFELLKNNLNIICEREKIISAVWPEYEDDGVSDWSIDQLIARLRNKLEKQKNTFEVVTVRTRGYKLVKRIIQAQSM